MKAMRSAVLLALLLVPMAYGASLSGVVKDPGGASIPNAAVSLESPKASFSAATDAQGRFEFPSIPVGEFRLLVTHDGFEPFSRTIATGTSSTPLAIALKVASMKTVVQVSAGRSTLRNLDPNYQAMRAASPRGVYRVNNLLLTRDAARFTFRSGSFSFLPPTLGRVTAGIFIGDGNFQLNPVTEIAAKHLTQISGAGTVDEDFSSLVVYFSDSTFGEITSHAEAMDESPDAHRDVLHRLQEQLRSRDWQPETYLQRIIDADDVPNLDADLVAELYNQTGGSFRAFIHGRKHPGLRFLLNPLGALPQLPAPEEVVLLNLDPSSAADGVWYLSHTVEELRTGSANSAEDKRLVAPENYKIETVIGSNQHLSATCDVQFRALRGGVRAIKFDLLPDLQVSRLTLDGGEIPFLQEGRKQDGSLYVVLPEPLAEGRTHHAVFEYEGGGMINDLRGGLFVILPKQPWYPRVGGASWSTYDMTFWAPRDASVIASGDRVRSENQGGQNVSHWVSTVAIPVAGFNYGYFLSRQRTDESNGFQLEAWIGSNSRRVIMPNSALGLTRAENAVRVFRQWFGDPPYTHLAVTEGYYQGSIPAVLNVRAEAMTDDTARYVAMSSASGGAVDRPVIMPPARAGAVSGSRFDESLPREVSRQWWGGMLEAVSFHDEWLMRGLTDFSGSVYDMAAERDTGDFLEHWRLARIQLLGNTFRGVRLAQAAPLWLGVMAEPFLTQRGPDPAPNMPCPPVKPFIAPCTALTGMKGGYVIHMLRRLMFDSVTEDRDFIAMMRDFTSTFAHRSVATEDFQRIIEKHMKPEMDLDGNHSMDWFFRE